MTFLLSLAVPGGLGLVAGVLIGCIGIGGVILVPALTYLAGVPIHVAIAAAMMSYLLSGLVGTLVYARKKSIRWDMALWLCAGAMPAALAGAWAGNAAEPLVLELAIGLLTLASGLHALRAPPQDKEARLIANPLLAVIGAVTGFASAITGTGGPLVLVPILLWLKLPVLAAIGLSQAIQLPIAMLATLGNAVYGELDVALGALLAVGLTVGAWIGARIAHAVPLAFLRGFVSVVLVAVGGLIFLKVALELARMPWLST